MHTQARTHTFFAIHAQAPRHSSSLSTFPLGANRSRKNTQGRCRSTPRAFRYGRRPCEASTIRGRAAEAANPARLRRHPVAFVRRMLRTVRRRPKGGPKRNVRVQHFQRAGNKTPSKRRDNPPHQ
jgi:hypothetical protein